MNELLDLLRSRRVQTLVDVRAHPQSRRNPQFNAKVLGQACGQAGIGYQWAGRQLGGRRRVLPQSVHSALEEGLRGFADYMQTKAFIHAVDRLLALADRESTAIMCAEYDPARCHRGLIADYLSLQGHEVIHLIRPGETVFHKLHHRARRDCANLIYDRFASGELDLN